MNYDYATNYEGNENSSYASYKCHKDIQKELFNAAGRYPTLPILQLLYTVICSSNLSRSWTVLPYKAYGCPGYVLPPLPCLFRESYSTSIGVCHVTVSARRAFLYAPLIPSLQIIHFTYYFLQTVIFLPLPVLMTVFMYPMIWFSC